MPAHSGEAGEIRPIACGCQVCLILVKQRHNSGTKLNFGIRPKVPAVLKNPFSEFQALLQSQRGLLLAELREKITASGEGLGFANQSKFTDDDAVADTAASMDVALVIRESEELQLIDAALARIADGSYGSCADCGDDIARARLKAYPMAERCLACQERHERLYGRAHNASP